MVPLEASLPERLAGDVLLAGKVDLQFRLLHLVDKAQHGKEPDEPPGEVGMPAVVGPGSGRHGLGVQCDPAAVPVAGGVGVVPAVVPLRLWSARNSCPRLSFARLPHLWHTELTKPVAVMRAAAQGSGYQHRIPPVQRVERQRHEESRRNQERERPALPLHQPVPGQVPVQLPAG